MENTITSFPKLSEAISKIETIIGREFTLKEYYHIAEVIAEDRVEISKWTMKVTNEK